MDCYWFEMWTRSFTETRLRWRSKIVWFHDHNRCRFGRYRKWTKIGSSSSLIGWFWCWFIFSFSSGSFIPPMQTRYAQRSLWIINCIQYWTWAANSITGEKVFVCNWKTRCIWNRNPVNRLEIVDRFSVQRNKTFLRNARETRKETTFDNFI